MKTLLPCCMVALLCGCTSFGTPKEVSIPVIVPCVSTGDIPEKQASLFDAAKDKSIFDQVKALLIDLENDVIYQAGLEAVIAGCK